MTDTERELRAMREQMDQMRLQQRRVLALAGSVMVVAAVGAILLASRPALSDPAAPVACGHSSQLYCFLAGAPAQAAQVNSNFESAFRGLDNKLDKTGGTLTGDLTVPNLTINGTVSLGMYTKTSSGSGGGATAVCNGSDLVLGGEAYCPSGSSLLAARSTAYNTSWGYFGTCSNGALVNVTAFCLSKVRP